MALHGLGELTLGVTEVDAASRFYRDFGLDETAPGCFATAHGGDQLRLVRTSVPPDFVQPGDVDEIAAAIKEHAA